MVEMNIVVEILVRLIAGVDKVTETAIAKAIEVGAIVAAAALDQASPVWDTRVEKS
jgi:hypothetical protein